MIDDATSQTYGRFVGQDSTEENLRGRWGYLERWGRPGEFYPDKSSLFTVNRAHVEAADEAVREEWTQIGRALRELGRGWIAAPSPQAQGRGERFFGTAQDRRVKGLRGVQADSLEAAQTYLEQEYLPPWNQRFTWVPEGSTDAHRPLRAEHQLAAILRHGEERFVTSDYTLRYQGKIYPLAPGDVRPGLRGGQGRVEQRLDGSMAGKFREHGLSVGECQLRAQTPLPPKAVSAPQPRPKIAHQGMKNFHLHQSPPWGAILGPERSDVGRETG
jgi:hypothetical protein